ncbi:hypothetical protein Q31a_07670 [Aureliella helgolandensis]|uniref:Uncharacterized protein n=1 Tax=Aureliella helgolandensis TaxID=2527968 RepID=A0A518G1K8_9BACT|nr:hypothetical protein Q31a_07670 [Aureliella helgolandensis]
MNHAVVTATRRRYTRLLKVLSVLLTIELDRRLEATRSRREQARKAEQQVAKLEGCSYNSAQPCAELRSAKVQSKRRTIAKLEVE